MRSDCILILICFLFCTACNKEEENSMPVDYRDQWVGEYTGVKSTRSFEDDQFTTEITFDIVKADSSETELLIFEETIPIDEEGSFGPDYINNTQYEISFDGDKVSIAINVEFPLGIALPCFIKAEKQD